jgi:hypothetical protein
MGRFRGLPAVLAMLLGGAALALAAGAVAYLVRSRAAARSDGGSGGPLDDGPGESLGDPLEDPSDTASLEGAASLEDPQALGDQVSAELAETEAASEAALEFQALEADDTVGLQEAAPDGAPGPIEASPLPARRAERRLPQSAQWTLMAAAVVVGALVGLMLFLLTGGTIGR